MATLILVNDDEIFKGAIPTSSLERIKDIVGGTTISPTDFISELVLDELAKDILEN